MGDKRCCIYGHKDSLIKLGCWSCASLRPKQYTSTLPHASVERRFWSKVLRGSDDECWLWLGLRTKKGSCGQFHFNCRSEYANRFAYILKFGVIPKGKDIHRKCDNKLCVNPTHLAALSMKEGIPFHPAVSSFSAVTLNKCINGHEFNEENTYLTMRGTRVCRKCANIATTNYKIENSDVINEKALEYYNTHKNDSDFIEKRKMCCKSYYNKHAQDPTWMEKERVRNKARYKRGMEDPEWRARKNKRNRDNRMKRGIVV